MSFLAVDRVKVVVSSDPGHVVDLGNSQPHGQVAAYIPAGVEMLVAMAYMGQKLYMSLSIVNQLSFENYISCFSLISI